MGRWLIVGTICRRCDGRAGVSEKGNQEIRPEREIGSRTEPYSCFGDAVSYPHMIYSWTLGVGSVNM